MEPYVATANNSFMTANADTNSQNGPSENAAAKEQGQGSYSAAPETSSVGKEASPAMRDPKRRRAPNPPAVVSPQTLRGDYAHPEMAPPAPPLPPPVAPPIWVANSSAYLRDHRSMSTFRQTESSSVAVIPRPMFLNSNQRASDRKPTQQRFHEQHVNRHHTLHPQLNMVQNRGANESFARDRSRRLTFPTLPEVTDNSRRNLLDSISSVDSPERLSDISANSKTLEHAGRSQLATANRNGLSGSWPNFACLKNEITQADQTVDGRQHPKKHRISQAPNNITTITLDSQTHSQAPSQVSGPVVVCQANGMDSIKFGKPPSKDYQQENQWGFFPRKYSPNMHLLRRVNERAKKTESLLFQMKVMAIIHLMVGLVMLALDWAHALLLWEHTADFQLRLFYILRSFYPAYITVIGSMAVAAAMNKRSATNLLVVGTALLLATFCLAPNNTPLVHSIVESIQFSRAKTDSFVDAINRDFSEPLNDAVVSDPVERQTPVALGLRRGNTTTGLLNEDADSIIFQAQQDGPPPDKPIDPYTGYLSSIFNNAELYQTMVENYFSHYTRRLELMTTVNHLRVAYCIFGGIHLIVTALTCAVAIRLSHIQ